MFARSLPALRVAVAPVAARSFATLQTFLSKSEVTDRVLAVVKSFEKVDPAKVTPSASFTKDLGFDSLDQAAVVMALEEEFCVAIPDTVAANIASNADAIEFIAANPQAK